MYNTHMYICTHVGTNVWNSVQYSQMVELHVCRVCYLVSLECVTVSGTYTEACGCHVDWRLIHPALEVAWSSAPSCFESSSTGSSAASILAIGHISSCSAWLGLVKTVSQLQNTCGDKNMVTFRFVYFQLGLLTLHHDTSPGENCRHFSAYTAWNKKKKRLKSNCTKTVEISLFN